ncbi:MAG: S41 family peptidase [Neisseriaceae bacterium]|nr:S41 family peptidase [Neisseriaceae bacterium]
MSYPTVKKIALYCVGALTGIGLSVSLQAHANQASDTNLPVQDLRTFAEVYGRIKAEYVEEKPDSKLIEDAIKGMASSLDPHSEYMDTKGYLDLQENTSGEFGGLGLEVGAENGLVRVISPIEGAPAEKAGIKSGDLIVKIDDTNVQGLSLSEAVKLMRGKPGTKIKLTLSRTDYQQPLVIELTRAIIKTQSVRSKLLESGYGYVRIAQFQDPTTANLVAALNSLRTENKGPLKGLVLDLRDDPGGILNGAVGVSAVFLPQDALVVSTKGRGEEVKMTLKARPQDYLSQASQKDPLVGLPAEAKDMPIVVLTNSGTASASEIVAGALQDHKRAVIVGTQSFGKGSVQTVLPLSNGGGLKITTALYYTPNNHSIQARGIVPDVLVKDKDRLLEMREADLTGHISNPNGDTEVKGKLSLSDEERAELEKKKADLEAEAKKAEAEKTAAAEKNAKPATKTPDVDPRDPNPSKDAQLARAIDLIKDPEQWQKSIGLALNKPGKDDLKKAKDKEKAKK